ncbi:asparagine synthase (glutamine-hydrolyzing) [Undibacterium sp. Ji50W]|uniref:asparagine synthase (glutamine-hydrolyzing) n=1 Tax=Undibacterium sp. Ji50W TaxID=3413041 RepID=UPI003BF2C7DB
MCGVSGYQMHHHRMEDSVRKIVAMNSAIHHRGPDDEGISLIAASSGRPVDFCTTRSAKGLLMPQIRSDDHYPHWAAFGHLRFSIIDISTAGHQPFWSDDRKVCISFNGEIYNFLEIRAELQAQGVQFHTSSDTEVLVCAYQCWGVQCFAKLNGFWALSLYDANRNAILLARDRLGKAPLYVSRLHDRLAWSSEIKGLRSCGATFDIRTGAVVDFVQSSYRDLGHQTFYENVSSFPAASYAWIDEEGHFSAQSYWSVPASRMQTGEISDQDAIQQFKHIISNAVAIRLRADVPIGFELSGGMDSSALVGFAASAGYSLKAYTVAFPGKENNEEPFARMVAERYPQQVDYTVLRPPPEDFLGQMNDFVALMDEPFHAPNMLTNHNIWQRMKEDGIKISINGAAGDEVLAGYAEYFRPYLRHLGSQGRWFSVMNEMARFSEMHASPARVLRQSIRILKGKTQPEQNSQILRDGLQQSGVGGGASLEINQRLIDNVGNWRMNYWLRSGNQSAMGVPLEVRAPFLDHRLLEFAFSLPLSYLIRNGWLKWILRKASEDLLPSKVVWRKAKMGFPFPLTNWLIQHEREFLLVAATADCPFIDLVHLQRAYLQLAQSQPFYLWRVLSVIFWWHRCVNQEELRFIRQ